MSLGVRAIDDIPFRHLVQGVDSRAGTQRMPLLSVSASRGVVLRTLITGNESRADDLGIYKVCNSGDLVINRMSAYQGALGVAAQQGLVSPDYLVLRPVPGVESRYLHHLCRSAWFVGEMSARVRGIGSIGLGNVRTPRINVEDLGGIRVSLPDSLQQRRIADFLDDQVALLDRAIDLRKRQAHLLAERHQSWLQHALINNQGQSSRRPLAWLCDQKRPIQYGIVLPGPDVADGIPIIKGGDVAAARMSPAQLQCTTREIDAQYARSRVREGDLVIAIRGSYGEICKVPAALNGANLTQDSARIAPSGVDLEWLHGVLETPDLQSQMVRRATGAMVKGINIFELRRLQVPTPRVTDQVSMGREVARERRTLSTALSLLTRSLGLLRDRKQAVITAAVAGQFDVTAARSVA